MFRSGKRARLVGSGMALASALTLALGMGTASAVAAPQALRPDTPSASDGSVVRVAATTGRAIAGGESGFAGTGRPLSTDAKAPMGESAPIGIESIFGTDDRIRINPTTSYPARAVVFITRNGAGHCTGWLFGPDIVATAGHCLHTGGSGGTWYTGLAVWPGRNGAAAPYGSCAPRLLHSVTGWTVDGNEEYDYGAIKLNCTIGNTVGWFGYWWQAASLAGTSTLINGYPGDKPFGEQWRGDNVARTVTVSQTNQIFYTNDTIGGMSGSAVYQNRPAGSAFCAGICSMAIHGYGFPHGAFPHNTYNHAARITEARFNNLQAWRNAP